MKLLVATTTVLFATTSTGSVIVDGNISPFQVPGGSSTEILQTHDHLNRVLAVSYQQRLRTMKSEKRERVLSTSMSMPGTDWSIDLPLPDVVEDIPDISNNGISNLASGVTAQCESDNQDLLAETRSEFASMQFCLPKGETTIDYSSCSGDYKSKCDSVGTFTEYNMELSCSGSDSDVELKNIPSCHANSCTAGDIEEIKTGLLKKNKEDPFFFPGLGLSCSSNDIGDDLGVGAIGQCTSDLSGIQFEFVSMLACVPQGETTIDYSSCSGDYKSKCESMGTFTEYNIALSCSGSDGELKNIPSCTPNSCTAGNSPEIKTDPLKDAYELLGCTVEIAGVSSNGISALVLVAMAYVTTFMFI